MYQIIIVVHVLLGLGVIGFVLIQQGKGADAGAAFGSASSGSVFGAQGASSFLSRTTAILATLFFATSLGLAVLSGNLEGEADLMDAPEDVFADVPLVERATQSAPSEALPVINEEAPQALVDQVNKLAETATEQAEAAAGTVESNAQQLVDSVDTVLTNELAAEQ